MADRGVAVVVGAGLAGASALVFAVVAFGLIGTDDEAPAPIAPALVVTLRPTGGAATSATPTGEPSGPGHSGSDTGTGDHPTEVPRTVETIDDDHG